MSELPEVTAPAPVAREPDAILDVVWIDEEARPTGMVSKSGNIKYQRKATTTAKDGSTVEIPVVGTVKQFESASTSKVEAYYGEVSGVWYFQPHLDSAGVSGPRDMF